MQRAIYTDEQRVEALALLAEVGKAEASRQTGIPAGTIASWGTRHGVRAVDDVRVEAMRQAWAERRAALADRIGEVADQATEQLAKLIATGHCSAAELTRAIAVLVDRAQLLSGGATERTETTVTSHERISQITDELARRRQSKAA